MDIVEFDIGGALFSTSAQSLRAALCESSVLHNVFSDTSPRSPQNPSIPFIDADPACFRDILNVIRDFSRNLRAFERLRSHKNIEMIEKSARFLGIRPEVIPTSVTASATEATTQDFLNTQIPRFYRSLVDLCNSSSLSLSPSHQTQMQSSPAVCRAVPRPHSGPDATFVLGGHNVQDLISRNTMPVFGSAVLRNAVTASMSPPGYSELFAEVPYLNCVIVGTSAAKGVEEINSVGRKLAKMGDVVCGRYRGGITIAALGTRSPFAVNIRLRLYRNIVEPLLEIEKCGQVLFFEDRYLCSRGFYEQLRGPGVDLAHPDLVGSPSSTQPKGFPVFSRADLADPAAFEAALLRVAEDRDDMIVGPLAQVLASAAIFDAVWNSAKKTSEERFGCYMCGNWFYASRGSLRKRMCEGCLAICEKKRNLRADLSHATALVTGARIKIGKQVALRLLRNGATVIATSRFPRLLQQQFEEEADSAQWMTRLHVFGLDLCDLDKVQLFIDHIKKQFTHIDILINNAAQTIRRPRAYYHSLIGAEMNLVIRNPEHPQVVNYLGTGTPAETIAAAKLLLEVHDGAPSQDANELQLAARSQHDLAVVGAMHVPADRLSLQVSEQDQVRRDDVLFPPGRVDAHGEPLDLRTRNTWTLSVDEISTREMLEVQSANVIAPFMLISQLRGLLAARPQRKPSFVVNVSSPEGQFSIKKNHGHVHTNMAKAALNMMTRTIAADFANEMIFVTSVDTGWVSKNLPVPLQSTERDPPLSDEDGAARVLAPIFDVAALGKPAQFGVFLVHFEPAQW